jgi:hypothetical protein
MKTERSEVKSKSKIVGTAQYPVYDNLQEAIDSMPEEKLLALINAQTRTNAMNSVRAEATTKPSTKKIMNLAFAEITPQEIADAGGDPVAVNVLIEGKMNEIKARLAAQSSTEEDSDSDEDDNQ